MSIRVGSIVFSTEQGLGILAKDFYDHGIVTDVLVMKHRTRKMHPEWYPYAGDPLSGRHTPEDMRRAKELCDRCDVMLFFETPFYWELLDYCRAIGKPAALMPMYECTPTELPARPDAFLCPSLLDLRYFIDGHLPSQWLVTPFQKSWAACKDYSVQPWCAFTPVPVPDWVPYRKRERAEVFVHNAGHGGLKGRNGTAELIEAIWLVKSPAKFIIRSQDQLEWETGGGCWTSTADESLINSKGQTLILQIGSMLRDSLYTEGDVFIFPEKFNGLSLPLQEARAAGMLVMATDRFPMNTWLPSKMKTGMSTMSFKEERYNPLVPLPGTVRVSDEEINPLIPVQGYTRQRAAARFLEFDEAVIDPKDIAAKIDEWYGRDISAYSESAVEWRRSMSWGVLGPKYKELLCQMASMK